MPQHRDTLRDDMRAYERCRGAKDVAPRDDTRRKAMMFIAQQKDVYMSRYATAIAIAFRDIASTERPPCHAMLFRDFAHFRRFRFRFEVSFDIFRFADGFSQFRAEFR